MDLGIAGKAAIVSGASRGIGLSVAHALAAEGVRVTMTARGREALELSAQDIRRETGAEVLAIPADMSSQSGVEQVVSETISTFGALDIAVSNVDGPKSLGFETTSDLQFYESFQSMIMSVVWLARGAVPKMKEQGWGRIVNIGSDCAIEVHREIPLILANTTRPAAAGLHKTLADELGPFGITVNTIAVGGILTDNRIEFHERYATENGLDIETVHNAHTAQFALRRFGHPDEVGSAVAFLCSERAGFITGEVIAVDGGRTRSLP